MLVGLLTDFGTSDTYVAEMKAALLAVHPEASLVDITHDVEPFHVRQAAFLLRQAMDAFPADSLFLAVVDPGVGTARRGIAVRSSCGYRFVGPDNGLAPAAFEGRLLDRAVHLDRPACWRTPEPSPTFHGRDLFAPVAGCWMRDPSSMDALGTPVEPGRLVRFERAGRADGGVLVLHVDRYGNVVLDLPARCLAAPEFRSWLRTTYGEAEAGSPLLLVNSAGYAELAIREGSAARALGLRPGDRIALADALARCSEKP